ncbi:MAG TPA: elongation factor P maturation arginine rhamnosyltransferase EarP, partial [Burkholderiales bacterium]|nr:elongation factor P maturation arginine rhamnosyltransferase EarP [Burkholderiales bacterium]
MSQPRTWDIFCRVVDNYGDAAVCWRLAQQLTAEHEAIVRLWIDDLTPLHALCHGVKGGLACQTVGSVEIRAWPAAWQAVPPAEIVIEAFGCGLPHAYVDAMVQSSTHPVWIVLEYLSAESWVPGHHGLPSPHPRWGIPRYFFFPGFVEGTGGILREKGLMARREAFGT